MTAQDLPTRVDQHGRYMLIGDQAYSYDQLHAALEAYLGRPISDHAEGPWVARQRERMAAALHSATIAPVLIEQRLEEVDDTEPTEYEVWRDALALAIADHGSGSYWQQQNGDQLLLRHAGAMYDVLHAGPPEA